MKHRKIHARLVFAVLLAAFGAATFTTVRPVPAAIRTPDCPGARDLDCANVPDLICKTACNQGQSLTIRDRCEYQQRLHMERYDKPKSPGAPIGEMKQNRKTTVVVRYKKDETGEYLVVPEVTADTDDNGREKTKVDPKANTGLASQAFLDLIFFPLLPEKLPYYEFEPAPAKFEGERAFRFRPKPNVPKVPLAVGIVYVNGESGAMLTLEIEAMYNLEALDKRLKDMESIQATVDFSEFNGKYRMPTLARGEGVSNISRFKGVFKFSFEESKYVPALTMPPWSGIRTGKAVSEP